jgi:hypothetical protein
MGTVAVEKGLGSTDDVTKEKPKMPSAITSPASADVIEKAELYAERDE